MKSTSSIWKLVGVKADEQNTIGLLILYSFALGLATAFFYTPATSLFLQHFSRQDLPAGYILGGFFVFAVGRVVKKVQKKLAISALLKRLLLFLMLSTSLIIIGYYIFPKYSNIFVFCYFAWIRIYLYILGFSFWGLANRLFNVRQGKRIFSLIGAGEVISYIISFFSIPFILKIPGITTPHLLFLSLIGLVGTFFFASIIMTQNADKLKPRSKKSNQKDEEEALVQEKPTQKYFNLIFAMAVFPMLAIIFVEFLFFAQSQVVFRGQGETLSGFLAIFFGLAAIVEFSVKTFLSGRLVDRFGLKFGLIALPAMLAISFLLVSLAGFIPLIYAIFFPAIALSRLFLRAFRTSFYDPSFQVLFQPIPEKDRLAFQNTIEGGIKSYGNMIAGALVLLLMYMKFLELQHIAYIFLGIAAVWVWITMKMHNSYHINLNRLLFSTSRKVKDKEGQQVEHVRSESGVQFSLYYLKETDFVEFEKEILDVFPTLKGHFRNRVEEWIVQHLERQYVSKLRDALTTEEVNFLEDMLKRPLSYWEELTRTESGREQVIVANMLGVSKRYMAYKPLLQLMRDENPYVARAAYRATGKLKRYEVWPFLFEGLKHANTVLISIDSIFRQREAIIDHLIEFLQKNTISNQVLRLLIPKLVEQPNDAVVKYLQGLRTEEDYKVRNLIFNVIATLEIEISKRERTQLFLSLEAEVKDIVRFTHIIYDLKGEVFKNIRNLLMDEIVRRRENIFLLLSVMYDANIVKMIRSNLEKTSAEAKSFAVEILDMTVEEDVKLLVLPVMENDDPDEISAKYKETFPFVSRSVFIRMKEIVNLGYFTIGMKTRVSALKIIGERFRNEGEVVLKANAVHPHQIIRRLASAYLTDDFATRHKTLHILQRSFWLAAVDPFNCFLFDDLIDMLERSKLCEGVVQLPHYEIIAVVLDGTWSVEGTTLQAGEYVFIVSDHPYEVDTGGAVILIMPTYEFFMFLSAETKALSKWEAKSRVIYIDSKLLC